MVKQLRQFVIVMAAVLAATPVCALGAELMVNGSFEKTGGGEGKSPFSGWTGREWSGGVYTFAADTGRDGNRCLRISCVKQGRGGIGQVKGTRLAAHKRYFFSMWVKEAAARGDAAFVNFWSPDAGDITRLMLPGGSHDWKRVSRVVTPAKNCTLNLYIHNKTTGSIWLDDVSLRELAPGESPPAAPGRTRKPYAHIPAGLSYALGTTSPLEKIFRDETFVRKPSKTYELSAARGESEGFQLVILHPKTDLKSIQVKASWLYYKFVDMKPIPPSAISISPVGYINVRVPSPRMFISRLGPYPEVLLPNAPFDVGKNAVQPVFIDVKVAKGAAPGVYEGRITVTPANVPPQSITLRLRVRRFALPRGRDSHIRTITFMGGGWQSVGGKLEDYEQMALDHRLGVGGFAVSGTSGTAVHNRFRNWGKKPPYHSFKWIEPKLTRLMDGGMNAFMMAVVPNLHRARKDNYPDGYYERLGRFVREYYDYAKSKGWQDSAFVYGYDEVPTKHFKQARESYDAVKKACPEARMLLCLNEPEAVKAMRDHCDIYLIYIHNHLKSKVDEVRKPTQRVWWSYGCIYPPARPNQFFVYPALDVRVFPWIAHKYDIEGLSAWGMTYYHSSNRGRTFPTEDWVPTSAAPGDGCMIYPGPGGKPLPSLRLKAVRDGLEDYEYLHMLAKLAGEGNASAKKLLGEIHNSIKAPTIYPDKPVQLLKWRNEIADVIENAQK